jgi:hypothetical protein
MEMAEIMRQFKMLPNFLIIGAQKSGSTFFLNCLSEHPEVFMPPGEVRFFEDPEYHRSTIQDLEKLFRNVAHKKACGIKRPGYLARPECPERIHQHIPDAKLVAILRNPIERAISAYFHLMKCGFIPVRPLEEGLTNIVNGEYKRDYPKSDEIVEFGFYYQHLTRYLNFFEKSQMLILTFDTIRVDALGAIQQAYQFIGVSDNYVPRLLQLRNGRSTNAGMYSIARLYVNSWRNLFMYTYNEDRTRRYPKQQLSFIDRVVSKAVLSVDSLILSQVCKGSKSGLSVELSSRLCSIYEKDIEQLEHLLGRDLSGWKIPAISKSS